MIGASIAAGPRDQANSHPRAFLSFSLPQSSGRCRLLRVNSYIACSKFFQLRPDLTSSFSFLPFFISFLLKNFSFACGFAFKSLSDYTSSVLTGCFSFLTFPTDSHLTLSCSGKITAPKKYRSCTA